MALSRVSTTTGLFLAVGANWQRRMSPRAIPPATPPPLPKQGLYRASVARSHSRPGHAARELGSPISGGVLRSASRINAERFRLVRCAARSVACRSFVSRTTWIVSICGIYSTVHSIHRELVDSSRRSGQRPEAVSTHGRGFLPCHAVHASAGDSAGRLVSFRFLLHAIRCPWSVRGVPGREGFADWNANCTLHPCCPARYAIVTGSR